MPAQRIHHSSVPSTRTITFLYRSAAFGHSSCGSEQTSSLILIYATSNVCAMNKVEDVGHFRILPHGVVDSLPLTIAYRKKERKVEVLIAGQSVCGSPSVYSRTSCIWPVACEHGSDYPILFTVSYSSHIFPSRAKACL